MWSRLSPDARAMVERDLVADVVVERAATYACGEITAEHLFVALVAESRQDACDLTSAA